MDYQAKTDWAYNDTVTEQDLNRIEAGLGDLHQRLDTSATSELVLQPGTQTVQVARDTPFHLSGISGRMLLNLLGRSGNCESLNGWTFTGTGALNTSQFVAGTTSIQITAGASGGIMSRNVELKAGKTYVLAASIKLGTATGAMVSITGITNGSVATSSSSFATSYMRFTATASTHTVAVVLQATQGQTAYMDAIRLYEVSAAEYSQLSSMTASKVEQTYPYTEGLAGVKNPYAIRWTSAAKTDVAAMLALDTELLAPPVPADDTDRDRLEQGVDGQYYKTSVWNKIVLDGSLPWAFAQSWTGYKAVTWQDVPDAPVSNTGYITKYNKAVLSRWLAGSGATSADSHVLDGSTSDLWLTVSAADSGWGDNYTPTQDEIKAYFYGWKMYDASTNAADGMGVYSRTDGTNKRWTPLASFDGATYSGNISTTPMSRPEVLIPSGYRLSRQVTSYELVYKRDKNVVESVASEGTLNVVQDSNVVEVGTGLIFREATRPQLAGNYYWINGATNPPSTLNNRVQQFVCVYKNNRIDQWDYLGTSNFTELLGLQQAQLPVSQFDNKAAYSVTYFDIKKYPSVSFTMNASTNERAILKDLIRDVQQTTRRVSAVELTKAEKNQNSSPWLVPTLLNGWTAISGYRTGYHKIGSSNIVQMSGVLTGGSTAVGTVLFYLPQGYRPASSFVFTANSRNDSGNYNSLTLDIRASGAVLVSFGTPYTSALTFEVTFEAEQ